MTARLDISLLVPGMPFDGLTIDDGKSLGGSESAAYGLAEALGRRGHNVVVFTNAERPRSREDSRVQYANIQSWEGYVHTHPHHIAIAQRIPAAFVRRTAADMNVLWCHDLPQIEGKNDLHGVLWNVDRLAMVSDFHRKEFERVYDLGKCEGRGDNPFAIMRNAVDMPNLQGLAKLRDPNHLLYTSRPERGLDVLLAEIMPRVLKERPEARLSICTYDNPTDRTSAFVERCRYLAQQLGDGVSFIGPQSKENLYGLMRTAGALVYPCPSPQMPDFAEVSCITFMEAMHCGLPVVTTKWGASPETLKGYDGAFLSDVRDYDSLAANVAAALCRVEGGDSFSGGALRSWDDAAGEWEAMFEDRYSEMNSDPKRLFYHWLRRSEIDGCRRLVEAGEVGPQEAEHLKPYDFMLSDEALEQHYKNAGGQTLESLESRKHLFTKESLAQKDDEPRFGQLLGALRDEHAKLVRETGDKGRKLKVLDYGCGHGWFAAYACQHMPEIEYVGVDLDPGAIEWAYHLAGVAEVWDRTEFYQTDAFRPLPEFDVAICSEVLEHVTNPQFIATNIEGCVREGGLMLITVPFGPVEYGTWNWTHFRNHIREFTRQDLSEIFGAKPDTALAVMHQGFNEHTGDGWGHFLVSYRADHCGYGEIDWARKRKWTMPRETLSVSMICGPDVESTLGWCLESIEWIADEIVIGDNGMSDESKAIAAKFGARLVPAPNPITCDGGFAEARNASLAHCTMDWVLWIDDDEKLTDPANLTKYLRKSLYRGWSVHQHHLSTDMQQVDRPVRVFRRTTEPLTRFYGVVHEHPEMRYNEGPGRVGQPPDLHILHIGYENEATRMKRFRRNLPLLERGAKLHPDRTLDTQLICRDSVIMAREFIRQVGGQYVPPQAQYYAAQCIDTFRGRYLGQDWKLADVSPVPYYSAAAQMLGGDIRARVSIEVSRRGQGADLPDPSQDQSVFCFVSMDDLNAYIEKQVKAATDPLEGPQWDGLNAPE